MVNSRSQKRSNSVWRRRRCELCGAVFSTGESAELGLAWQVAGEGRRSHPKPFSRDKLFLSLYDSCRHRKTALSDAQGLTETIINKLPPRVRDGTIGRKDIIGVAQVALNRFDRAASVYYAARHKA